MPTEDSWARLDAAYAKWVTTARTALADAPDQIVAVLGAVWQWADDERPELTERTAKDRYSLHDASECDHDDCVPFGHDCDEGCSHDLSDLETVARLNHIERPGFHDLSGDYRSCGDMVCESLGRILGTRHGS